MVLAVLIVGSAGFYFKIYRPRHEMGGTEDDAEEPEEKFPDADEGLLVLTDSALEKLRHISDEEYAKLDLFPDFD